MKKMIKVLACMLALVLCLAGCAQANVPQEAESLVRSGVLVLRVNPEIAVEYDENGVVTGVIARNDDALKIINSCTGLIGKQTRDVVTQLVTAIGDAGYFVEEIDGERRHITLEIESGSCLPNDTFVDDVIADVKEVVKNHDWNTPLDFDGLTDYNTGTDYGPNNDGVTDFGKTDYEPKPTEAPKPTAPAKAETDYGKTDYDPVTDYGTTDYEPKPTEAPKPTAPAKAETDYGKTDYDPVTDYGTTNYEPKPTEAPKPTESVKAETDYGKTDYDPVTDYGATNYEPEPTEAETDYGKTDYNSTNYGDSAYNK